MQQESGVKHLVIVHGYLFEGSGSNVYVQNIARTWKEQGHKVTVVCQDRNGAKRQSVDDYIEGMPNQNTPKLKPGQLRIVVPDIDNLLPVYVMNEYEGYTVKQIPDMTQAQIENHIQKTSDCIKAICKHDKVDKVLANHAILSPINTFRALEGTGIPFDVKIHGSGIVYTLKPHPRLLKYCVTALKAANKIYTGTEYVKNELLSVFKEHASQIDLQNQIHILTPGMDPNKFSIPQSNFESQKQFLKRVQQKINKDSTGRKHHTLQVSPDPQKTHNTFIEDCKQYNQRVCDSDLLQRWVPYHEDDEIILFIGALINTKGIGQLLAMAPSLLLQKPNLKFVFCGFGTYREHMSQLLNCFEQGDLEKAKIICKAGDFINQLNIEDFFFKIDKKVKDRIMLLGYTDHSILSQILPLCSICVVPSKIPEAFGMVTVESMAAGVLPICNNHSGLSDVLDLIQREFPQLTQITRVNPEVFFKNLPSIILEVLKFKQVYPDGKQKLRERIRKISVDNFSWSSIGHRLAN